MPQLSRDPIEKYLYYSIRDDLIWIFGRLRGISETKAFYYDFFTKTERVMFAKRLAVALLVHKGFSYDEIRHLLHVSTSTITRVSQWLDKGGTGVTVILDSMIREQKSEAFWKRIDIALAKFARLRK